MSEGDGRLLAWRLEQACLLWVTAVAKTILLLPGVR